MEEYKSDNGGVSSEAAQSQQEKAGDRRYLGSLEKMRNLGQISANDYEEHVNRTRKRIKDIRDKFKNFIKDNGGLSGAKEALVKSRKKLLTEMETGNPIWMTTFPVSEIIQGINLEGMITKHKPDPNKAKFNLETRELKYDIAPDSIRGTESRNFGTIYADLDYYVHTPDDEKVKIVKEKVKEAFKGQIVIDIASGDNVFGYLVADQAEAKAYVGVDPYRYNNLFNEINGLLSSDTENQDNKISQHVLNGTPIAIVGEDMLSFLKRLPSNSVSIWCSGIDNIILHNEKYRTDVAKEILRVLDPKGAYIGGHGYIDDGFWKLETDGLIVHEEYFSDHGGPTASIYRKK